MLWHLSLLVAAAAAPTKFVDCNCLIIGPYVLPAPPVPALPADGVTGTSPGGKYSVNSQPGNLQAAQITVTRLADSAVLLNHEEAADWGFSPDDDRFVVARKSVGGAPATVALYDLTAVPAAKLQELTPSDAGSAISFSPTPGHPMRDLRMPALRPMRALPMRE